MLKKNLAYGPYKDRQQPDLAACCVCRPACGGWVRGTEGRQAGEEEKSVKGTWGKETAGLRDRLAVRGRSHRRSAHPRLPTLRGWTGAARGGTTPSGLWSQEDSRSPETRVFFTPVAIQSPNTPSISILLCTARFLLFLKFGGLILFYNLYECNFCVQSASMRTGREN